VDGGPKNSELPKFAAGDYVLLTYPNRPPNKLAGMYRGPLVITLMDPPDLIKVRDLISNKESMVHANRIRPFKHPKSMPKEKIETLASTDLSMSKKILDIQAGGRIQRSENFECVDLDTSLKTILC